MRLLRTDLSDGRLELQEFMGDCGHKYAILSHAWGEDELTMQDIQASCEQTKKGYSKVVNCCSRAKADNFEYVWIDTCCIDKTSSAELSEAINSMYRWYQNSDVCYVFLADVPSTVPFSDSRWFTRGWTLQELIAPSVVIFVDENWKELGTKATLQEVIMRRTNIPAAVLAGNGPGDASVAQKMSWAARRQTTRVEDIAYCLLGIFGVHMPLLYGEGERAFIRLQEEIIKTSDDHSIFAWRSDDSRSGLLATGPAAFADSGDVMARSHPGSNSGPMSISNRGVHLNIPFMGLDQEGLGIGLLNCTNTGTDKVIAIYLRDTLLTMDRLERVRPGEFELLDLSKTGPSQRPVRSICVKLGRLGQTCRVNADIAKASCQGDALLSSVLMGDSTVRNDDKTRTKILRLAARGDGIGVCRLLGTGIIPANLQDTTGKTPLLYAAENGHTGLVWLLLTRQDVSPSSADINGWTALSHAARRGHKAVVESLLARMDMQPYLTDGARRTPLSHAAETGQDAIIRSLLTTGKFEPDTADSDGRRPLFYAVQRGHVGTVRLLIDTGRVDVYEEVNKKDLLGWVLDKQAHDIATILIKKDVSLERKHLGATPLMKAAATADTALVSLLLEKGANIERADENGMTPLGLAAKLGKVALAELLLEKGANIEGASYQGMRPLALAAEKGHDALAKLLLEKGANIEVTNNMGMTPLNLAAAKGHDALTKLLLEKAKCGKMAVAKLLLEKGAKVEQNEESQSALACASLSGHEEMVRLLLAKGAMVKASALDAAAAGGHLKIFEILVDEVTYA
ncbi:ankyrin repeat-containing domain protein [Cladorrhinum sp. PSN259]|nr:ankyrin repeat-containing domain protein [Cladorrhinum sp. PSN259]